MPNTLRSATIRFASQHPEMRQYLLPLLKVALQFDTQKQLNKYKEDHDVRPGTRLTLKNPPGTPHPDRNHVNSHPEMAPYRQPRKKDVAPTVVDWTPEVKAQVSGHVDAQVAKMKPEKRKSLADDIGHTGEKPAKAMKSFGQWSADHNIGNLLASSLPAAGLAAIAAGPIAGVAVLLAPIGTYGAAYLYGKMTGKNAPGFGKIVHPGTGGDNGTPAIYHDETTFERTAGDSVDPKKLRAVMDYVTSVKPKLQKAMASGKGVGEAVSNMYANLPEGGAEVLALLGKQGPGIVDEMLKKAP